MSEEEEYDFTDFKNNDVGCDRCGTPLGTCSEDPYGVFLCITCTYGLEDIYKKEHPEEYD